LEVHVEQGILSTLHHIYFIFIHKGSTNGQKIQFEGEGDEEPGILAGDLIVVIDENAHPLFTRKGKDLHVNKTLTLGEALVGFSFKITTLDDRVLSIRSGEGEVIRPNDQRFVTREGMPVYRSAMEKGIVI
jgi:DnaJ-class molecular chaperone